MNKYKSKNYLIRIKVGTVLQSFPLTVVIAVVFYLFLGQQPIIGQVDENDAVEKTLGAARALIKRVVPEHADQFSVQLMDKENGLDVFSYSSDQGKILLKGNNGVSIASALNWYLKNYCKAHFSWTGDQLQLPGKLPLPDKTFQKTVPVTYRVHFNYCTLNYSASWWDWKRWEREIDFLAMNGVNAPLSVVGLEGVWYHALLKFGFSDLEAREFLVGPAYFAWQWMTNIQSHGGPLPKNWIDGHIDLGQRIMARQLELGMQPIQQGFSGYVPRAFLEKFPDASLKKEPSWLGFEGTMQLDPLDPLFQEFGKVFLQTQRRLFGAHGLYAADPFHEGEPPQKDEQYLNAVGMAINKLLADFDPRSKWVMQAWSIRKEIVSAVPKERLLILDLGGERYASDYFWGYDFVVGNLHNFGGRTNLHGDLGLVASNPFFQARQKTENVVGTGLFMEGINQNPVYYDLAFEMPFHTQEISMDNWLDAYVDRRYGFHSPSAKKAWHIMLKGPYGPGTNGVENSSIICARPALQVKKSGPNSGFNIPYDPMKLVEALRLLLQDVEHMQHSGPYRYDVVDIARQVLSNLGQEIHKSAAMAFENQDIDGFGKHSQRFLQLLDDLDSLLGTRSEFSFDAWVTDARAWGETEEEKRLYEWNASMLLTHWGSDEDSHIFDYSWREWSGLIKRYYRPRWKMFYSMLEEHLMAGTDYSEKDLPMIYGRETLRANTFYDVLADWELAWIESRKTDLRPGPNGDEIQAVQDMLAVYATYFKEYYKLD